MDTPNKEDARKQSMEVKLVTKLTDKSIAFDETWLSLYEEANKHVNKGVAILATMAHALALEGIAKRLKTPDNPKHSAKRWPRSATSQGARQKKQHQNDGPSRNRGPSCVCKNHLWKRFA